MTIKNILFGILFTFYILLAFGVAGSMDYDDYYGYTTGDVWGR